MSTQTGWGISVNLERAKDSNQAIESLRAAKGLIGTEYLLLLMCGNRKSDLGGCHSSADIAAYEAMTIDHCSLQNMQKPTSLLVKI